MERKLLDMTSQLFISEYNLIVEYGDNFQFAGLMKCKKCGHQHGYTDLPKAFPDGSWAIRAKCTSKSKSSQEWTFE